MVVAMKPLIMHPLQELACPLKRLGIAGVLQRNTNTIPGLALLPGTQHLTHERFPCIGRHITPEWARFRLRKLYDGRHTDNCYFLVGVILRPLLMWWEWWECFETVCVEWLGTLRLI